MVEVTITIDDELLKLYHQAKTIVEFLMVLRQESTELFRAYDNACHVKRELTNGILEKIKGQLEKGIL